MNPKSTWNNINRFTVLTAALMLLLISSIKCVLVCSSPLDAASRPSSSIISSTEAAELSAGVTGRQRTQRWISQVTGRLLRFLLL